MIKTGVFLRKKTDNKYRRVILTQKTRKPRLKLVHIVFTVCLILILAPAIYFGWMLASTYMDSHSPVLGNRYENDLNPAITKDQLKQVDEAVGKLDGVTGHSVHLALVRYVCTSM